MRASEDAAIAVSILVSTSKVGTPVSDGERFCGRALPLWLQSCPLPPQSIGECPEVHVP
jgi:hypothetical protein